MKILVVGSGRMGAELAYRLYRQGHEVCVVDGFHESFQYLPADFQGRVYEGEVINQEVLHRAGIEHCDALAAVTNSDALNLVVATIARNHYRVPHVLARNYDPIFAELYDTFGIQFISATTWGAQRLEEMIYHGEVRSIFSAGNGEVDIYELKVPERWCARPLQELVPAELVVTSLTRNGEAMIPAPDTMLETGDLLHVAATLSGLEALSARLEGKKEA